MNRRHFLTMLAGVATIPLGTKLGYAAPKHQFGTGIKMQSHQKEAFQKMLKDARIGYIYFVRETNPPHRLMFVHPPIRVPLPPE